MSRKIDFMTLLEDYFETYLPYSRGLSPNTIKSYKQSFLLLFRFMLDVKKTKAEDIRFSALTYDILLEFFSWLETDRQCKTSTRKPKIICTFCIFRVCAEQGFRCSIHIQECGY